MTRRLTIVLDDSVTETECGECRFRRPHPVSVRSDICTNDGLIKSYPRPLIPYGERTLECLEAERAAARMVDPTEALRHLRDVSERLDLDAMDDQESNWRALHVAAAIEALTGGTSTPTTQKAGR